MTKWISRIAQKVSNECLSQQCDKDGCSLKTDRLPPDRLIIDLDCCDAERHHDKNRCDYLIVAEAEDSKSHWVLPVELKSGGFQASSVVKQIQAGVRQARVLVPVRDSIVLVPILAHRRKKRMHKNDVKLLRATEITLFGKKNKITLVECGDDLKKHLDKLNRRR